MEKVLSTQCRQWHCQSRILTFSFSFVGQTCNSHFIIPWWRGCLDQCAFQHHLQQAFSPSLQLPAIATKEPFKYRDLLKCCTFQPSSSTLWARCKSKSMDQNPVISLFQTGKPKPVSPDILVLKWNPLISIPRRNFKYSCLLDLNWILQCIFV